MADLKEKVAVVTGAARYRGIGRAIALRLARDGADVVVSARGGGNVPDHELEMGWQGTASLVGEIEGMGRRALAIECDVTDRAQVADLIDGTLKAFGRLDIVVNNAGVPSGAGATPVVSMDDEEWLHTVDVNLNGVYHVSKAGARAMIDAGNGGAIVNLSSTAGRVGMANYGAYSATKFAVIGLTQQMAVELAPSGIRVNCICPGSTDTDMMDGTFRRVAGLVGTEFERIKKGVRRQVPLGRQGDVSEQAAAVAFLASDDASYITGQTLNVDGGLRMD
ncbi:MULTISPECIES: SDR family NAD(P)-dependent oxidoreductase [unclassified Minwuia]|jgi:NAD(P)-dependent dehydrogenase (short-subunit alcohol dehydrogenase family)|uniref:SDR family NAD(P)-dependent oxidoreductase n=1 Tax=unclassified Minwuia TaxID=2618799 RepID=UPI0024796CF9|nr:MULTISPECIES: SDR family NAD(P)-dependent oxidoreductase [unclassified Minwuia]